MRAVLQLYNIVDKYAFLAYCILTYTCERKTMDISGIVQIVFSPTGGTQKVADMLCGAWPLPVRRIDISQLIVTGIECRSDELCVIAVPSFGGRVPELACRRLRQITARSSPAVLAAVYGNRAFEDTLAELADTAASAGFIPIAGIAAVAEHSIIHDYAAGRPDAEDEQVLRAFASGIWDCVCQPSAPHAVPVPLPGNRPYKPVRRGVLVPHSTARCTRCGLCAVKCPAGAIAQDNAHKTDADVCISCMRCVAVCPHGARRIPHAAKAALANHLKNVCSVRKENELFM